MLFRRMVSACFFPFSHYQSLLEVAWQASTSGKCSSGWSF